MSGWWRGVAMTDVAVAGQRGSDFAGLCRRVRAAGLLERRRGHYLARIGVLLAVLAGSWWTFAAVGDSWFQLILAALMGVISTQLGFLGHEGGHRQVFRSRWANDLLGLTAGNVLVGLSFSWWVDKHNRHHAHPNHEDHDPDIGDGVLAFTIRQVQARTGRFSRAVARNQAWLFFPLLTLEGLNLRVASFRSLLSGSPQRRRLAELVLLVLHVSAYLSAVLLVLSPVKALVFLAVHQGVFGLYMGCAFAPNHKGMPILAADTEVDYLRRQVITSRNVRGGWFTDLLLGGLNYQIEHHLFPNMPRPSLRRAQRIVRAYCHDLHLPYTETSLIASYTAALKHLHTLGAALRAPVPATAR
jgi:fatty acid desaturase